MEQLFGVGKLAQEETDILINIPLKIGVCWKVSMFVAIQSPPGTRCFKERRSGYCTYAINTSAVIHNNLARIIIT
jgi:hypothetical protein